MTLTWVPSDSIHWGVPGPPPPLDKSPLAGEDVAMNFTDLINSIRAVHVTCTVRANRAFCRPRARAGCMGKDHAFMEYALAGVDNRRRDDPQQRP